MNGHAKEIFAVTGLSAAVTALNWTQINGALTAILILSNVIFVWRRIRKEK